MEPKICIVHANTGDSYYPQAAKRLERSLIFHGWAYDLLLWDGWPNDVFNKNCKWNIKASALAEAFGLGYDIIIWLDASIWAIRNPNTFVNLVKDRGLFTWRDGHTVAETASDKALQAFKVTREEASQINEVRSSVFGFDVRQPVGRDFYSNFIKAAQDGIFEGEKSVTPRDFGNPWQKFASRQDQTVVSLLRHKLYELYKEDHNNCAIESDPGEYVIGCSPHRYGEQVLDSVYFAMEGI